ncbi:hypothetical protein FB45DRAFT_936123, partial [Roridomyces roridus]
ILQRLPADANCNYKMPDTLKKLAVDYGHICMLAHNAKYYRNPKDAPAGYLVANIIAEQATMRTMGVKDMPPAMETGRVAILAKVIGKALTDKRFEIKSQVVKSLESKSKENKSDIAALTCACIGSTTNVKPTAALYQRIAIIRSVAAKNMAAAKAAENSKAEDKFWVLVDQKLEAWRNTLTAPGALQGMYAKTYDADVAKHGKPDSTVPVTPMKDVADWLVTLCGAMEK